ncbi:uncharacterized protein A4U43_C07F24980 [Asparagus officinalis]|uniref:RNA helicase n=1 Tax=Asparagus officinalis TaxID=4686 RepID=A0A5P1EEN8_ASPOF|nr:DEAD-box ATP-dependent RNA helicase 53-like [Asparagus officinalis]ONK64358.1 uncharacterized protein A4U43_C07F24980 [Asparagus officinalis]
MEGRDMIGRAITGSGKTLAFGIPILDKIIRHQSQSRKKRVPSALVLAPTRELARQVQQEFKVSAPNLSSTCLYGGISISNQVRTLGFGIDIAVGTPGRIIDLVERGALDLSEVKFVVLDEADQMLAIGFQEDVECILGYLPARKQCMLFSATMPSWVNDLSRKFLRDPLVVDLVGKSDQKLAEGITLYSIASSNSNKQNLLPTLISKYGQGGKSIIFTRTKKDAESLSRTMRSIVGSKALHGDMQQLQRDRTLAAFRDGRFDVLVATDVAARGLDIPNVDLVIHFEMPNSSEFFVHRSGRTGRAGNKGTAILMFSESQRRTVRSMERELGFKFEELRGITSSVGMRREVEESFYESDDDLDSQKIDRPNYSKNRQYGNMNNFRSNYGRSRGSNTSKYSESNFRGKNYSSSNSEPRNGRQSQSYGQARTQLGKYGDYGQTDSRWSSRFGARERSSASDRMNGNRSSAPDPRWSSRFGVGERSSASDRTYGNRTRQRGARQRSTSQSDDFDFDGLLDLFKDN